VICDGMGDARQITFPEHTIGDYLIRQNTDVLTEAEVLYIPRVHLEITTLLISENQSLKSIRKHHKSGITKPASTSPNFRSISKPHFQSEKNNTMQPFRIVEDIDEYDNDLDVARKASLLVMITVCLP
jgi:hypothetical protein